MEEIGSTDVQHSDVIITDIDGSFRYRLLRVTTAQDLSKLCQYSLYIFIDDGSLQTHNLRETNGNSPIYYFFSKVKAFTDIFWFFQTWLFQMHPLFPRYIQSFLNVSFPNLPDVRSLLYNVAFRRYPCFCIYCRAFTNLAFDNALTHFKR